MACSAPPNTIGVRDRPKRGVIPWGMGCDSKHGRVVQDCTPSLSQMQCKAITHLKRGVACVHSQPATRAPNSPLFCLVLRRIRGAFSPNVYFQSKSALSPLHVSLSSLPSFPSSLPPSLRHGRPGESYVRSRRRRRKRRAQAASDGRRRARRSVGVPEGCAAAA